MANDECTASMPELPPSAYNGSHLPAKAFRRLVLLQHRIKICDAASSNQTLPKTLVQLIESLSQKLDQFDSQTDSFQQAIATARFRGENVSLSELSLSKECETRLSRGVKTLLSQEALPEEAPESPVERYSLTTPRVGLACGFGRDAFTSQELSAVPPYLANSGHIPKSEAECVASVSSTVYAPFLTFEHVGGQIETTLEAANNQSAINGACCIHAVEVLHDKIYKKDQMPQPPQAFSCSLDNEVAYIYHHRVNEDSDYCMVPVCRFELRKRDHIKSFLAWIEAIEQWALLELLPPLKASLSMTPLSASTPLSTSSFNSSSTMVQTGKGKKWDLLHQSLKTKFNDAPFRQYSENGTPISADNTSTCSSSVASWGSPIATGLEAVKYPSVSSLVRPENHTFQAKNTVTANSSVTKPAYSRNLELVWNKRFGHSMNEIKDLQSQMQDCKKESQSSTKALHDGLSELRGIVESLRNELADAKQHIQALEANAARQESLIELCFKRQEEARARESKSSGSTAPAPQLDSPLPETPLSEASPIFSDTPCTTTSSEATHDYGQDDAMDLTARPHSAPGLIPCGSDPISLPIMLDHTSTTHIGSHLEDITLPHSYSPAPRPHSDPLLRKLDQTTYPPTPPSLTHNFHHRTTDPLILPSTPAAHHFVIWDSEDSDLDTTDDDYSTDGIFVVPSHEPTTWPRPSSASPTYGYLGLCIAPSDFGDLPGERSHSVIPTGGGKSEFLLPLKLCTSPVGFRTLV